MRNYLIIIATLGSGAVLLGALGFQYIGEMAPCKLCYWQRYPHVAALPIGALALIFGGSLLPRLGALAALTSAGIGIYHTGVERGWWEGPSTCTSGDIGGLSSEELLNQIMAAPLVRCDDVPWELFTLSMASWNAIVSIGLALVWWAAANHKTG
ncbi:MAG: disulfide bond formation protein B [Paracoccaceae bacterium]|jgi:disulfide bond formation protein DsbB